MRQAQVFGWLVPQDRQEKGKSKPAEPLKTAYIYKSERHWVEIFRATARIIA